MTWTSGQWPGKGRGNKTEGKGKGKGRGRSRVSEVKKDEKSPSKENKGPEEEAREVGEVKAEPESFKGALMMLSDPEGSAVKSKDATGLPTTT